jgi:hypothetical protein
MDERDFDTLTQMLAATTDRRAMLRVVASGVLVYFGVGCRRKKPAPGDTSHPGDTTHPRDTVPKDTVHPGPVADACPTASRCGNRQYCNPEKTCICVQTAEGPTRCGQIPSTCHVQLCTTSADCAALGAGYFCDTPNSGCCTDPPKEKARCVAPCGATTPPACPPERVCAAACCPVGQSCVNGKCAPPPTTGTAPCANDPATSESLATARALLAGGATSANLSPQGCMQFQRTVAGGRTTEERILMEGKPALIWTHSGTSSTGQRDGDLDGFFEWQATVTRGPGAGAARTQVTEYAPATQKPVRRRTFTDTGSVVHVQWEQGDAAGTLRTVAKYDAPAAEETSWRTHAANPRRPRGADSRFVGCSTVQETSLNASLKHAMGTAMECMKSNKGPQVLVDLISNYAARPIVWNCVPRATPNECHARLAPHSYSNPTSPIEISVETCFFDEPEYSQSKILFHEMLHAHYGPHVLPKGSPARGDFDQVEACENMCFGPDPVTKCQCASCLGTSDCDDRCKIYMDCKSSQQGFVCPCPTGPNAFRVFPTCSACLTACPSGLACAGFAMCIPINAGCQTGNPTCP